jgi:hypothetical protein
MQCGNMKKILLASLLLISSAHAAETKLTGAEMQAILYDKILYGKDVEQIFQKSGVTFYLSGGNQSQGNWKIEAEKYCSQWPPNEAWACYDMSRDGNKIAFISKDGNRSEMSLTK